MSIILVSTYHMTRLILLLSLTVAVVVVCNGKDADRSLMCLNEPYRIAIMSMHSLRMTVNRTVLRQRQVVSIDLLVTIANRKILQFDDKTDIRIIKIDLRKFQSNSSTIVVKFNVKANYLDRTWIDYSLKMNYFNNETHSINCSIGIITVPRSSLSTRIYIKSMPYIVIFISIQMGILLDLEILKEIVRRPGALTIGFCCQYGLMPMIAYGITKIFRYPALYGFGLFVIGCCPGGTASNQLTVIFNGDLNLSVLMSFISTIGSFVMMPLWLYTLGTYAYLRHLKLLIPFQELIKSLLTALIPLFVGIILAYFIPRIKPFVKGIIKPVLVVLLVYFFGFGTYVNFHLFSHIDWRIGLTAPLLPWFGYIIGGIVSWMCGQDWIRIKTIGIETGIQNVGIGFLVLLYSLPEPDNYRSTVIAMIILYLSSQPFYVFLFINFIREKLKKT